MARARWHLQMPVAKVDDGDLMQVFGFLSVANTADGEPITDSHGDQISISTLEKAAYDYNLEARGVGLEHQKTRGVGRLLESCVFTPAKKKLLKAECAEGWWVGFKIDDPAIWKRVKAGELKMLSIGGWARREALSGEAAQKRVGKAAGDGAPADVCELLDLEVDEGSLVEAGANPEAHILLWKKAEKPVPLFEKTRAALKSLFTPAKKMEGEGEAETPPTLTETLDHQEQMRRWWDVRSAFEHVVSEIMESQLAADEMSAKLTEAVQQFLEALSQESAATAKAVGGVEHVDAALSAVLAAGVSKSLKEDLTQTLDLLTQGSPAQRADKEKDPMPIANEPNKGPADEAITKRLADLEAKAKDQEAITKAAVEKAEKLEKELAIQRATSKTLEKASIVKGLAVPGMTTEKMVEMLVLNDGTETHDVLLSSWRATSKAMEPLMRQEGSAAGDTGTGPAQAELQKAMDPLLAGGMSAAKARASVLSKNLDLARRVGAELRAN